MPEETSELASLNAKGQKDAGLLPTDQVTELAGSSTPVTELDLRHRGIDRVST